MKVIYTEELEWASVYESIEDEKVYSLTGKELKEIVHKNSQQLIDLFPIGMYVKDKNGKVLVCNKTMLQTLGDINGEKHIGKNSYDFASVETSKKIRANDEKIMREDIIFKEEEVIKHIATQTTRYFHSTKCAIKNKKGKCIAIAGLSEEITERKKSEQQRQLAEENRQAATLASGAVAHDIKNTLAPLCMDAELLQIILTQLDAEFLSERLSAYEVKTLLRIGGTLWERLRSIVDESTEISGVYGISALEDLKTPLSNTYNANEFAHQCTLMLEENLLTSEKKITALYLRKLKGSQNAVRANLRSMSITTDENTAIIHQLLGSMEEKLLEKMVIKELREHLQSNYAQDVSCGLIVINQLKDFYFECHKVSFYRIINRLVHYMRRRIFIARRGKIYFSSFQEPNFFVLRIQDNAGIKDIPPIDQLFNGLSLEEIRRLKIDLKFCHFEMRRIYGGLQIQFLEEGCCFDLRFPKMHVKV